VNIKAFRCDNGGEFVNRKATELMKEKGIVLQLTVAYNPQQNGRAEVMNRHYSEMVRSMLVNAALPNEFWAEALMHATFIKNRTIRKDQKESPVKMCFGKEENLSRIKVFGCKVEYLIPKEKRNKLEEKTRTGIYLGTSDSCYPDYSNSTKHAYRLFDLESCEVVYARDATFFENVFPFVSETLLSLSCDEFSTLANLSYTYEQVMNSEERGSWEKAIKDELKSLEDNGTWDIVEEDKTQRLVEMKWVLNKKFKADGSFDKYKARLVARGFTRTHGIDYLDSYCPTPKPSIIRVLLMKALENKWVVKQLDVKSAFLNGVLKNDVYCKPIQGMNIPTGKVVKLKKALYGLQEAGREWYQTYRNALLNIGFKETKMEPCLFIKVHELSIIYVLLYIDDQLIVGQEVPVEATIKEICSLFEMNNFGIISSYLGVNHEFLNGDYYLGQKKMVDDIIIKFKLSDSKISQFPLSKTVKTDYERCVEGVPYREIVGSLMYLGTMTRPDIMFSVSWLSRYLEKPSKYQWMEAKRVVRYLKGTKDYALKISTTTKKRLVVYTDSDFADGSDYKSTSGCVVCLGRTVLSWFSRKQSITALSTTEAEFIALGESIRELLFWKSALEELKVDITEAVIYCDNQSAIKIALGECLNARTKHFGVILQRVRDHVKLGDFKLEYIPTNDNIADIMTKPLSGEKFKNFRDFVVYDVSGLRGSVEVQTKNLG